MASIEHVELMNVGFCRTANTGVSVCKSPLVNITDKVVLTSLTGLSMSCSSFLVAQTVGAAEYTDYFSVDG